MSVVKRKMEGVVFNFLPSLSDSYLKFANHGAPEIHLEDIMHIAREGGKKPTRGFVKITIKTTYEYYAKVVTFDDSKYFVLYCPPGFYDTGRGNLSASIIVNDSDCLEEQLKKSGNCDKDNNKCLPA